MVRASKFEGKPEMRDLADLASSDPRRTNFGKYHALLAKLPPGLTRAGQAKLLRAVMVEVVDRAYVAIRQPDGDRVTAGHVIAAGVVMGLATERADGNYSVAPVDVAKTASSRKPERQKIAATWISERSIGSDSQFRLHEEECLEDFNAAFVGLTSDKPAIRTIIQRLGIQIEERLNPVQPPANELTFGTQYVARPALHEEFERHVAAGAKVIAFVGLPGAGKTWLARALTMSNGVEAPRIRIINGEILARDLPYVPSEPELDPLMRLSWLLNTGQHPFVIIDNLDDTSQIKDLIPANHESTVVATCRSSSQIPPDCHEIEVGNLLPYQAAQLIESRLKHPLTADEVDDIRQITRNHPLLLDLVCVLLLNRTDTVASFCAALRSDISRLGNATRLEDGVTFVEVLSRMVAMIRKQDIYSYQLLRALAILPTHPIRLSYFMRDIVGAVVDESMDELSYTMAIRTLANSHLVDLTNEADGVLSADLHPFVRATLAAKIFCDNAFEVWIAAMVVRMGYADKQDEVRRSFMGQFSGSLAERLQLEKDAYKRWVESSANKYSLSEDEMWASKNAEREILLGGEWHSFSEESRQFMELMWLRDVVGELHSSVGHTPTHIEPWLPWLRNFAIRHSLGDVSKPEFLDLVDERYIEMLKATLDIHSRSDQRSIVNDNDSQDS